MASPKSAEHARLAQLRGALGESMAAAHYRERNYQVLAANYRTRQGEIDLVLAKEDLLVFCEVKTRSAGGLVTPAEAVDARKQQRILQAAGEYMVSHSTGEVPVRFDVAEVLFSEQGEAAVHIIENAFTA